MVWMQPTCQALYNLDATDALRQMQATINNLQAFQETMPDRLLKVAQASADVVQNRVQQRGENADGERMQTQSRDRVGAYSRSHGSDRSKAGLQTGIVDLTYSGQFWDAWGASQSGDEAGAGFSDSTLDERANHLEDYYGGIFGLSDLEGMDAINYMNELNQAALFGY